MASKYSTLKGVLPEKPDENPKWKEKIEAEQKKHEGKTLLELTAEYNANVEAKKKLAEEEKLINLREEALTRSIWDHLEALGSDIWRGGGFSFSQQPKPIGSVDDKAAMMAHFKKEGMEDLFTVNPQTLTAMVKEEAANGKLVIIPAAEEGGMPEVRSSIPGVKVFMKRDLSVTKSSKN